MGTPMGIVFGFIAGVVGAALWAAIAYYGNLEIGYLAVGIGIAVGFAVATGAGKRGPVLGVAAVLITIAAICGGKFAMVEAAIQQSFGESRADFVEQIALNTESDEFLISCLADDVAIQEEAAGNQVDWPEGVDPSEAVAEADYPPAIWEQAQTQWDAMDDAGHGEYKQKAADRIVSEYDGYIAAATNEVRSEGFLESFGMMDLLFFGLGVATAWGIAGKNGDEEEAEVPSEEPV